MKKSRGVSLISLVVTIVVIVILAGVTIYLGIGVNVDETQNTMDYNEIFELTDAVAQRALFNRLNSEKYQLIGLSGDFNITIEQMSGDSRTQVERQYSTSDGWYKINSENSSNLNMENVRREYLVNYETNEVISISPIYYEGNNYYIAQELKNAIGGGEGVTTTVRYDEKKGVNKPYVVEGMIPVKLSGTSWVVTNTEDDEWYDYASLMTDESGTLGNLWANIMLLDDIEVEGMSNAQVRNATISELEGKKVTTEGSMYVWIPRYSRGVIGSDTKIVFSKLTDDYFKDETSSENVIKAFEDNGVKLTGIWVSKYDVGYERD